MMLPNYIKKVNRKMGPHSTAQLKLQLQPPRPWEKDFSSVWCPRKCISFALNITRINRKIHPSSAARGLTSTHSKSSRRALLLINVLILNLRDSKFSLQDCQHMLQCFLGPSTTTEPFWSEPTVVGETRTLNLDLIFHKWNKCVFLRLSVCRWQKKKHCRFTKQES